MADYSCLRALEGHTASVLCCQFLSRGLQVASGSADGLVRLWDVRSGECVNTFDRHEDKIWALAVPPEEEADEEEDGGGEEDAEGEGEDEGGSRQAKRRGASSAREGAPLQRFYTGGSDARLLTWVDTTREDEEERLRAAEGVLQQEQQLANDMRNGRFGKVRRGLWLRVFMHVLRAQIIFDLMKYKRKAFTAYIYTYTVYVWYVCRHINSFAPRLSGRRGFALCDIHGPWGALLRAGGGRECRVLRALPPWPMPSAPGPLPRNLYAILTSFLRCSRLDLVSTFYIAVAFYYSSLPVLLSHSHFLTRHSRPFPPIPIPSALPQALSAALALGHSQRVMRIVQCIGEPPSSAPTRAPYTSHLPRIPASNSNRPSAPYQ